jgi:hypothetical protein
MRFQVSLDTLSMKKGNFYLISACLLLALAIPAFGRGGRGIRSVDFLNLTYQGNGDTFTLRAGKYSEGDAASWFTYELLSVRYVDFNGDGNDEAFVVIDYRTSGTYDHGQGYYVFAYRRGKPRVIFQAWREKPWSARIRGDSIIIMAPFWRGGGRCCPSGLETSVYRWRGLRFARVSRKRRYINTENWWLQRRA